MQISALMRQDEAEDQGWRIEKGNGGEVGLWSGLDWDLRYGM